MNGGGERGSSCACTYVELERRRCASQNFGALFLSSLTDYSSFVGAYAAAVAGRPLKQDATARRDYQHETFPPKARGRVRG